ncbi:hypothetical protein NBRC116592_17020 [Colwellia sp. KU-HH00111]|uniref:peptide chain release factor family protein n=1 Tax=Colwellia sp. KU-HH00111 TaxID=3127652 RepID=UPI003103AE0F
MKAEIDNSEILMETCCAGEQSPHTCGALRGIKLTHKATGIVVHSIKEKSQHANKLAALELLKMELVKRRFDNIDEDDLVDGKTFWEELNSGKHD